MIGSLLITLLVRVFYIVADLSIHIFIHVIYGVMVNYHLSVLSFSLTITECDMENMKTLISKKGAAIIKKKIGGHL